MASNTFPELSTSFLKEARQWDLPKMRRCAPVAEIWLSEGSLAPVGSRSEPPLGTGEMGRDPWAPAFQWAREGC